MINEVKQSLNGQRKDTDSPDSLVARKCSRPAVSEPPAPCRTASLAHGVFWTSRIPSSLKPWTTDKDKVDLKCDFFSLTLSDVETCWKFLHKRNGNWMCTFLSIVTKTKITCIYSYFTHALFWLLMSMLKIKINFVVLWGKFVWGIAQVYETLNQLRPEDAQNNWVILFSPRAIK